MLKELLATHDRDPLLITIDGAPDADGNFKIYEIQQSRYSAANGHIALHGSSLWSSVILPFLKRKYGDVYWLAWDELDPVKDGIEVEYAKRYQRIKPIVLDARRQCSGAVLTFRPMSMAQRRLFRTNNPNLAVVDEPPFLEKCYELNKTVLPALMPQPLRALMPETAFFVRDRLENIRPQLVARFGDSQPLIVKGSGTNGHNVYFMGPDELRSTRRGPNASAFHQVGLACLLDKSYRTDTNRRIEISLFGNSAQIPNTRNMVIVAQPMVRGMTIEHKGRVFQPTMRISAALWWDVDNNPHIEFLSCYWKLPPRSVDKGYDENSIISARKKTLRRANNVFCAVHPDLQSSVQRQLERPLIEGFCGLLDLHPFDAIMGLLRNDDIAHKMMGIYMAARYENFIDEQKPDGGKTAELHNTVIRACVQNQALMQYCTNIQSHEADIPMFYKMNVIERLRAMAQPSCDQRLVI